MRLVLLILGLDLALLTMLPIPARKLGKSDKAAVALSRSNHRELLNQSILPHVLVAGGKVLRAREMSHKEAMILNAGAMADFRESIGEDGKAAIPLERWVIDRAMHSDRKIPVESPFGVPKGWAGTAAAYRESLIR